MDQIYITVNKMSNISKFKITIIVRKYLIINHIAP
jgi:hypothetical protein